METVGNPNQQQLNEPAGCKLEGAQLSQPMRKQRVNSLKARQVSEINRTGIPALPLNNMNTNNQNINYRSGWDNRNFVDASPEQSPDRSTYMSSLPSLSGYDTPRATISTIIHPSENTDSFSFDELYRQVVHRLASILLKLSFSPAVLAAIDGSPHATSIATNNELMSQNASLLTQIHKQKILIDEQRQTQEVLLKQIQTLQLHLSRLLPNQGMNNMIGADQFPVSQQELYERNQIPPQELDERQKMAQLQQQLHRHQLQHQMRQQDHSQKNVRQQELLHHVGQRHQDPLNVQQNLLDYPQPQHTNASNNRQVVFLQQKGSPTYSSTMNHSKPFAHSSTIFPNNSESNNTTSNMSPGLLASANPDDSNENDNLMMSSNPNKYMNLSSSGSSNNIASRSLEKNPSTNSTEFDFLRYVSTSSSSSSNTFASTSSSSSLIDLPPSSSSHGSSLLNPSLTYVLHPSSSSSNNIGNNSLINQTLSSIIGSGIYLDRGTSLDTIHLGMADEGEATSSSGAAEDGRGVSGVLRARHPTNRMKEVRTEEMERDDGNNNNNNSGGNDDHQQDVDHHLHVSGANSNGGANRSSSMAVVSSPVPTMLRPISDDGMQLNVKVSLSGDVSVAPRS